MNNEITLAGGVVLPEANLKNQRAEAIDRRIKNNLVETALMLRAFKDEELYRYLNTPFTDWKDYLANRFEFGERQARKYYLLATVTEELSKLNARNLVPELAENGIYELIKQDNKVNLRNVVQFFNEIGINKAAELCAIEEISLKEIPYGGLPVVIRTGEAVGIDQIKESKDLTTLCGTPVKSKQPSEAPALEPAPKYANTVQDFRAVIDRYRADTQSMIQRFLGTEINQPLFNQCKPDLDLFYDELQSAANAVISYSEYASGAEPAPKLSTSDFVTTDVISDLCNVPRRTVQDWISKKKINPHYLSSRRIQGKRVWKVHPHGLPELEKNAYYAELSRRAREEEKSREELAGREREMILNSLTEKQRRKTLNIELALQRFAHLGGKELESALLIHNQEHPDVPALTYKTFIRHRVDYKEGGIRGIADFRGQHRIGETKIRDVDYDYFKAQYMNENEKSAQQCWEMTVGKARDEGRIVSRDGELWIYNPETKEVVDTFPTATTFVSRITKIETEAAVLLSRIGEHRFKQTNLYPHVQTHSENVEAGQTYVMDHHTFDVFCTPSEKEVVSQMLGKMMYQQHKLSDEELEEMASSIRNVLSGGLSNKKYVRLWLTNCLDYRTNKQLAWWLHEDAPNSDHVKVVFKWACEKYGIPDELLIDNGKDFLAYDFVGKKNVTREEVYDEIKIQGVVAELGVKLTRATPYQGQAKPIERQYQNIIDQFARQFPTYTGKDPKHLPESTRENLKKGNIPTAVEVIQKFNDYVENVLNRKAQKQSVKLGGKSPNQVWQELRTKREIKGLSDAATQLMTVRATKSRRIDGNGFKMSLMGGHYYSAAWMDGLSSQKEKYYAHWDPADWSRAFIYRDRDNMPMGWAEIVPKSPSSAKTEEEQQQVALANDRKREQWKGMVSKVRKVQKIASGMSLEHLHSYVDLENEMYEQEVGGTVVPETQHMRLVQTKLDEIVSDRKDSFENRLQKRSQTDLSRIVPDAPEKKTFKNPLDDVDISDIL